MPTRYLFFLSIYFWSKVIAFFLSKSCQSWTYYLWLQLTESRYSNKLKSIYLISQRSNNFFRKKMTYWMCFRFLATLVVCGTQLGNYAVELFQMTLESAWIYEIHHFLLNFVSIYRKEVKSIAITYFLATLHILANKNCNYALPSNRIDMGLVALKFCVFWCIWSLF